MRATRAGKHQARAEQQQQPGRARDARAESESSEHPPPFRRGDTGVDVAGTFGATSVGAGGRSSGRVSLAIVTGCVIAGRWC